MYLAGVFQMNVVSNRKKKGIQPAVPRPEDRDAVMQYCSELWGDRKFHRF